MKSWMDAGQMTRAGAIAVMVLVAMGASAALAQPDEARRVKAEAMIEKASAFLHAQQDQTTGGWAVPKEGPTYPAISALVLNGLLMQPGASADDEAIGRGVSFLLRYQQPDGGIYDKVLPSYNTSICVSAFARVNRGDAKAAVRRGVEFLRTLQWSEDALTTLPTETGKIDRTHPFYGGVGYGRHGRPDNSNLAQFLQAMHDAGVEASDPAMQRALAFLSRTQMVDAVNEMPYADGSNQGGFIYSTSVNKDRMGEGQSFAGEVAESLSGPPGMVAFVTLKSDGEGKPLLLKREDVRQKIALAAEGSSRPQIVSLKDEAIILLGPTADGREANAFEIRTPMTSAEDLQDLLFSALAGEVTGRESIRVEAVPAWKGVSRLRAYGSMTYAGFKGLIYAGLSRDDPRVQAAHDWIRRHYTLRENPGMGTDGLYYYLVTFGRAMDAWGEAEVKVMATAGSSQRIVEPRNWANDLIDRLAELQNEDGSFRSVDNRWMEDQPVLITAYGLLALQHAVR
jgi:hypothetical protein